jgi:hypothetical protein
VTKTDRLKLAHSRATAAWLALDGHTDAATVARMIAVAREGRKAAKDRQRQQPKQ